MTLVDPRRWRALAVLAMVQFLIVTDNTIANVALPSIDRDMGFTPDGLAWVINGYLLTAGGLVLFGGRLSDLFGRRRIFLAGAVLFGVASLACGLAPTPEALVAARFTQGVGEALAAPAALSLIAVLFPDSGERGKALGIWGGLSGLGAIVGVVLSGLLTELLDWRWVFLINIPVVVVAVALTPRVVHPDRSRDPGAPATLDLPGAVLVTTGATAVVYGLLASAREGWERPAVIVPLAAGLAALAALVVVELRSRDPLVPLRFFTNRTRVSANVAAVFLIGVMAAIFLLLTLYMQQVLDFTPIQAGLAYVPFCVGFVAAILASFALAARLGGKAVLLIAFLAATVGMAWLSRLPVDGSYPVDLLPALLILALGFGLAFPQLQSAAMTGVSEADAGLGAGVQASVQALANVLGVSVMLTVALRHTNRLLADGADAATATTAGYATAFRASVGSLVLGALIVLVAMPKHPRHGRAATDPTGTGGTAADKAGGPARDVGPRPTLVPTE